jgi:histidyl-tRNA synthetase
MIKKVRGTQDKINLKLQNFILEQAKKHLILYNFYHIETPILEHTKLFIHSLGEQTDVVSKEMYVFDAQDKEDSICLRPEATASTIRAYIENHIEEKPWKVFSHGPMFRRERPQKGRFRQFDQINIEVINSNAIAQDAHFIKMLDLFFSNQLFFKNYVIKLNFLGCLQDRISHKKKLNAYVETIQEHLCETCLVRKEKNILRIFDCKNKTCQQHYKNAPKLTDVLCDNCNSEWKTLQETLKLLSVNVVHNPYLVRGLDYYNKTVFEFCSNELGSQNSFCGGGRYNLGKSIGSKENFPSVGVGIGLERVVLICQNNQEKLPLPLEPALHLILPMSKEQHTLALLLAEKLQANSLCTDILLEEASMKSMMRKANKMGATYVLILGEDEQKHGTVSIKNMQKGTNVVIKQNQTTDYLHNKKI